MLVLVAVVRIGEMRMAVLQRFMPVPMRELALEHGLMRMLVVTVIGWMGVQVLVLQHFMAMRVGVVFGQVQPDAERHQQRGCQQLPAHGLGQKQHGKQRADERRGLKISAGARRPQVAQADDKQRQTHAIGDKADCHRRRKPG